MKYIESFPRKVFSPWTALPSVYVVFLILAYLAYRIPVTAEFLLTPRGAFTAPPSSWSYLVSILGLLVFIYSCGLGKKIRIGGRVFLVLTGIFLLTALTLKLAFDLHPLVYLGVALGYTILLTLVSKSLGEVEKIILASMGLALLFAMSILFRGIPIVEAEARVSIAVTPARALFHGFGAFSAVMLIVYQPRRLAIPSILVLAFIGVLAGFKSDAVSILVSATIAGLITKRIALKETLGGGLLVILILTLLSNYIAEDAYGGWKIPPYLYPFYRAGFTMGVFSRIVELSMPAGYLRGRALLDVAQRMASTEVLDYREPHIITSTLFGPGMLDFGLLGVVLTALFLGLYLGLMYNSAYTRLQLALYAMALTHVFILVEVGVQLTSIIYLLSLLYLFVSGGKKV